MVTIVGCHNHKELLSYQKIIKVSWKVQTNFFVLEGHPKVLVICPLRLNNYKTIPWYQEWFRPSVICLTKCTLFGQALLKIDLRQADNSRFLGVNHPWWYDHYCIIFFFILLTIMHTQISLQGYFHSRLACGPYPFHPETYFFELCRLAAWAAPRCISVDKYRPGDMGSTSDSKSLY